MKKIDLRDVVQKLREPRSGIAGFEEDAFICLGNIFILRQKI